VETLLLAQRLPVYTVDVPLGPGDLRRRLLVGRFQTREDADSALATIAALAPGATIILGARERWRTVSAAEGPAEGPGPKPPENAAFSAYCACVLRRGIAGS
jgi:hypothetical protein